MDVNYGKKIVRGDRVKNGRMAPWNLERKGALCILPHHVNCISTSHSVPASPELYSPPLGHPDNRYLVECWFLGEYEP